MRIMSEKRDDSYNHVLKYTSLFGGVQVLSILIGLVRNKAMALILGAGGMGFNALLTSMQNFASQCTNLGISFGAVPRLSELHEHQENEQLRYNIQVIRLWSLIAAALGMVFCVVASPLMNHLSFTWGNHTLHYAMLALAVAMSAITGGETAIMKATRQLGKVAIAQILTVIATLFVSVPLYYFYGHSGVVPAIVLIAFATMLITLSYSYRSFPFRFDFCRSMLREGSCMIRLGVAYILAAAIGSASEMAIRAYLNVVGSMDDVGLYNAAFMITITYAGFVFSAMETDYFPRLSGYKDSPAEMCLTVNNQIEVSLLLVAPLLIFFMVFLPILLPALYSGKFMPVLGMMKITILAMYFRSISLPIEYIPLAKGDSRSYLFLEAIYDVLVVLLVCTGYHLLSLAGTGIALTLASMVNLGVVLWYTYYKYGYQLSRTVKLYALIQLPLGFAAYLVALVTDSWFYWVIGTLLAFVSLGISLQILHSKTHLWQKLTGRIKAKLHKHGKD